MNKNKIKAIRNTDGTILDFDGFDEADLQQVIKELESVSSEEYSDFFDKYRYSLKGGEHTYFLWPSYKKADSEEITEAWSFIFNAEPYFTYKHFLDGDTFPTLPIIQHSVEFSAIRELRQSRYGEFIQWVGLINKEQVLLNTLSKLENLKSLLVEKLNIHIDRLEQIDSQICETIKVYHYETQVDLDRNDKFRLRYALKHLYQDGIRVVCKPDKLIKHWLPKYAFKYPYKPVLLASLSNGIYRLTTQKLPTIKKMIPLYEKLVHVHTAIYYLLNNMPLINDEEMPEFIDSNLKDAYEKAINTVLRNRTAGFIKKRRALYFYITKKLENPKSTNESILGDLVDKYADSEYKRSTTLGWFKELEEIKDTYLRPFLNS